MSGALCDPLVAMSLLSFVDLQERPPSPHFQKTVKAPRVLFDFVVERAPLGTRSFRTGLMPA